jgi:hypothetical protein
VTKGSILSKLIDVERVRLLTIQETWLGDDAHSPVRATYDLSRRADGAFRGQGLLSTSLSGEKWVEVTLPSFDARLFLERVLRTPLIRGAPVFQREDTDEHPRIEITLQLDLVGIGSPGAVCVLFTESPGRDHVPWGVFLGGTLYTTTARSLGRALRSIASRLQRPTLDAMAGR